jgi:hypothetical protein
MGNHVDQDAPSVLFYSKPGRRGQHMTLHLTRPTDPPKTNPLAPGRSFNLQLHPAFWFGMAMCDTQSYPTQVSTCAPDIDAKIVDPAVSPSHTRPRSLQRDQPGTVEVSLRSSGGASVNSQEANRILESSSTAAKEVAHEGSAAMFALYLRDRDFTRVLRLVALSGRRDTLDALAAEDKGRVVPSAPRLPVAFIAPEELESEPELVADLVSEQLE